MRKTCNNYNKYRWKLFYKLYDFFEYKKYK